MKSSPCSAPPRSEKSSDCDAGSVKGETENGEIIGGCIACAYEYRRSRMFLDALWVDERCRRHGIGEIDAYPEAGDPHGDENAPLDTFSPCRMLNQNYTGKGYACEAAHALFDYLFNEKGARRIYAYTEDNNEPSQRLCEKLGMRREGLFPEFISFVDNPDGTPRCENTYQYAILKKEWNK